MTIAGMKPAVVIVFLFLLAVGQAGAGDRFVDNGDGTVTDHRLGVMWSKTDNQGDINWHQAEKWTVFTFPLSVPVRYDNWRLPTLLELESLIVKDGAYGGYETACGRRVRMVPDIKISCGWVWSSEKRSISARAYNFHRGYHFTDRMIHSRGYRAIAVRNLNSEP
jgi:hypothetical protein